MYTLWCSKFNLHDTYTSYVRILSRQTCLDFVHQLRSASYEAIGIPTFFIYYTWIAFKDISRKFAMLQVFDDERYHTPFVSICTLNKRLLCFLKTIICCVVSVFIMFMLTHIISQYIARYGKKHKQKHGAYIAMYRQKTNNDCFEKEDKLVLFESKISITLLS